MIPPSSAEGNPPSSPILAQSSAALVVDGDAALRLGLKAFLREYVGFEDVRVTAKAEDAVNLIRNTKSIEVVLLSATLPDGDGLDVIDRLLREDLQTLSVLLLADSPDAGLEKEYRSRGTDKLLTRHFLTKPINFDDLEPIVRRARDEVRDPKSGSLAKTISIPLPPIDPLPEQDKSVDEDENRMESSEEMTTPPEEDSVADTREDDATPPVENETENDEATVSEVTAASQAAKSITDALDEMTKRIADLERTVVTQRRKMRSDLITLLLLVAFIWVGVQRSWFRPLEPYCRTARNAVQTTVDKWAAQIRGDSPDSKASDKNHSKAVSKPKPKESTKEESGSKTTEPDKPSADNPRPGVPL